MKTVFQTTLGTAKPDYGLFNYLIYRSSDIALKIVILSNHFKNHR